MKEKKDALPILMLRRGTMLMPAAPLDSEAVLGLPLDKALRVRVTQPRNVDRLRLYWALIGLIAENLDGVTDEALHDAVKVRLGYCHEVRFRGGIIRVPKSVAFDQMEEPEFAAFLDRFIEFVRTDVIPGLSRPAFERRAREMLGEAA